MSRTGKIRKQRREALERLETLRISSFVNERHAAEMIEKQSRNIEAVQRRNDTWRNLMTASAFARGLGNERPISEVIEESFPQLFAL